MNKSPSLYSYSRIFAYCLLLASVVYADIVPPPQMGPSATPAPVSAASIAKVW